MNQVKWIRKSKNSLSNQNILQSDHNNSRVLIQVPPRLDKSCIFPDMQEITSKITIWILSASPFAQCGDNSRWEPHPLPCYHHKDNLLITDLNIYNILSEKSVYLQSTCTQ